MFTYVSVALFVPEPGLSILFSELSQIYSPHPEWFVPLFFSLGIYPTFDLTIAQGLKET